MGKQAKRKQQRRSDSATYRAWAAQIRQRYLGQVVQFDLHQGAGVQLGRVTMVSDDGDVQVEALPGQGDTVLMMSLGFVEQTLTLVNG